MNPSSEKPNESIKSSVNNPTSQSQNASSEIANEAYSDRENYMRKLDETTVRVTNLPEDIEEEDLRDLFMPFGLISRLYLAKDKTNNKSKGFAFVTFHEKKDAQKAIACVSGLGYDHLILKVELANKPHN